jgi:hypothetical protein
LANVKLSSCTSLEDEAVSKLFRGSPNLRAVDLSWCVSLVNPQLRSSTVQEVVAARCSRLADSAILDLFRSRSLASVSLIGCRRVNSRHTLEQPKEVLDMVTKFCRLFERVAIGAPDLIISSISLLKVSLSQCDALNDDQVSRMFSTCPSLRDVDLQECVSLIDPDIHSTALSRITMAHCTQISETAVTKMFARCAKLTRVNLAGCYQLRAPVMRGGLTLLELNLQGCDQLDIGACQPNVGPETVLFL